MKTKLFSTMLFVALFVFFGSITVATAESKNPCGGNSPCDKSKKLAPMTKEEWKRYICGQATQTQEEQDKRNFLALHKASSASATAHSAQQTANEAKQTAQEVKEGLTGLATRVGNDEEKIAAAQETANAAKKEAAEAKKTADAQAGTVQDLADHKVGRNTQVFFWIGSFAGIIALLICLYLLLRGRRQNEPEPEDTSFSPRRRQDPPADPPVSKDPPTDEKKEGDEKKDEKEPGDKKPADDQNPAKPATPPPAAS